MRTLSSLPFCPCDGRQAGLWYLPAHWRYTTRSFVSWCLFKITRPPRLLQESFSRTVQPQDDEVALPRHCLQPIRFLAGWRRGTDIEVKRPIRIGCGMIV